MVRIKQVPEPLLPVGRITMRLVTREVIHEVPMEDDSHFQRDRAQPQYYVEYPPSPTRQDDRGTSTRSADYDGPNEYMTQEPNYARPLENRNRHYAEQEDRNPSNSGMNGTRSECMAHERGYNSRPMRKEQNVRQRMDPSFSQNFDGPNEYMTERSYARPTDNRSKQYVGNEGRNKSKSRTAGTRNEYMVEEPGYSNRPAQRKHYSRQRMDPGFIRNFDSTSEYTTDRSYARPMDNRSRQLDDRENLNPSYSRVQQSGNEHMVDDHLNSYRKKPSYRYPQQRTERVPMKRLQVNEYMTDHREAPLEVPRDSSIPMMPNIREQDDDASPSNRKRFHAVDKATKEIEKLQSTRDYLFSKRAMRRIIREVLYELRPHTKYRVASVAEEALQEAAEAFLMEMFINAGAYAHHSGRVTLKKRDIDLERKLRRW